MRLTLAERRFAEQVFGALLPGDARGRRAFAEIDTAGFWRCLHEDGAPSLIPGLRLMLVAVWVGPLLDRRFRRPFPRLSTEDQYRWLAGLDADARYLPRQLVATLKILACFAWFDDPVARSLAGAP